MYLCVFYHNERNCTPQLRGSVYLGTCPPLPPISTCSPSPSAPATLASLPLLQEFPPRALCTGCFFYLDALSAHLPRISPFSPVLSCLSSKVTSSSRPSLTNTTPSHSFLAHYLDFSSLHISLPQIKFLACMWSASVLGHELHEDRGLCPHTVPGTW